MDLVQSIQIEQVASPYAQMHAIINLVMQSEFHLNEIGDYVIGEVLMEEEASIKNSKMNRFGLKIYDQNDLEIQDFWPAYFEFFFPQEENIAIEPDLFEALGQKNQKVHFFFQRKMPINKTDYKGYFSTSKLYSPEGENGTSILLHHAFELNQSGQELRSVVKEDFTQTYHTRVLLLSKSEKEVIKLIVEGKSSWQISEILYLSIPIVNHQKKNIIRKLGINNLCQLMKFALLFNLVQPI
ncbi:helix-turn-helix transcriptional regulator [Pedobacter gandavensis]|uniref:helix-turn-helix domain-containing protein n=1 Tax=Pedobacter gandavensis TaxID=2679963 RepID=UPI00292CD814|nr:helix-turn-helix transcriptional regulator [Pedobacter gandavensis]